MTEPDPQLVIFELKDTARLLREALTDPVVCGVVEAVLDRAKGLKLSDGHPLEGKLRQATAELCFAYADWWRGPGALLFGPDVAEHSVTWRVPF